MNEKSWANKSSFFLIFQKEEQSFLLLIYIIEKMQNNPSHQKPKLTVEVKYGLDPESYVVLTDRFIRDKRVIFVVYTSSTPVIIHHCIRMEYLKSSIFFCFIFLLVVIR